MRTPIYSFALILSLALVACGPVSEGDDSTTPMLKRVEARKVLTTSSEIIHRFSGLTQSAQRARLSFEVPGRLVERRVDVGDSVQKGDLLAVLNDSELRHALAATHSSRLEIESRLAQARRDLERVQALLQDQAASLEEVEKTQSGVHTLEAALAATDAQTQETKRLLGETRLFAPYPGTITSVTIEAGEMVTPGAPLFTLAGRGGFEVQIGVTEDIAQHLQVGTSTPVSIPSLGNRVLEGRVRSVSASSPGVGHLFPVIIDLPYESSLASGLTAEVSIPSTSTGGVMVPIDAVVNASGKSDRVWAVEEDGSVRSVEVIVMDFFGDHVSLEADLEPGDRVITAGQRNLLEGETVEVIP